MIAGKKYVGMEVDIWSCGVILFALLCGYLPFEDPNTSHLYKKILSGDYHIPKFVSSDAKSLLKYILTTDPNKRYSTEEIRKHNWYQMVKTKEHEGIIVGIQKIPVSFAISSYFRLILKF
jgi:5'-AMP-activated protein kinase, catalytic alpha subunit